jgi:hypothetical protein
VGAVIARGGVSLIEETEHDEHAQDEETERPFHEEPH